MCILTLQFSVTWDGGIYIFNCCSKMNSIHVHVYVLVFVAMLSYSMQRRSILIFTLCSKKNWTTKLMVVTLFNLNRFSKFFHC